MCDIIIKLRFYSIAFSMNIIFFVKKEGKEKKIERHDTLMKTITDTFSKEHIF